MIYGPRGKFLGAKFLLFPAVLYEMIGFMPKISGGTQTNWIHSEDVARSLIHLMKYPIYTENRIDVFNVAEKQAIGIGDFIY